MGLRNKAIIGIRWIAFQQAGTRLMSLAVLVVLARLLEPAAFGVVALATAATAFLQSFVAGGFAAAIVQRKEVEREHLDTAFWINVGVAFIAITVLWAVSEPLARSFKEPELAPVLRWMSLLLIIRALNQVQVALLKRKLKFKSLAIRQLIGDPIGGVAGVAMAVMGFGVWSLVARELVTALVRLLVLWGTAPWRPGLHVSMRHFNELFSFGASMLGTSLAGFFRKRSADLIIGYFLGSAALGYFTIANRFFRMIRRVVSGTLGSVMWPVYARLQEDKERLRRAFEFSLRVMCFLTIPVFVGLASLAGEIVPTVFGEKWFPAVPVMQVLAILGFLNAVMGLNSSLIIALGKPHWHLSVQIVVSVLSVVGFLVVVDQGIVAVAGWYVLANVLVFPISIWMAKKLAAIDAAVFARAAVVPAISAVAMAGAIYVNRLWMADGVGSGAQLIMLGVVGAAVYIVGVSMLSPSFLKEVKRLIIEAGSVRGAIKSAAK